MATARLQYSPIGSKKMKPEKREVVESLVEIPGDQNDQKPNNLVYVHIKSYKCVYMYI